MTNKNFKPNQKVRNLFGEVRTVRKQANECQVFVYEECNNWYHPTKLYPVIDTDQTSPLRTA